MKRFHASALAGMLALAFAPLSGAWAADVVMSANLTAPGVCGNSTNTATGDCTALDSGPSGDNGHATVTINAGVTVTTFSSYYSYYSSVWGRKDYSADHVPPGGPTTTTGNQAHVYGSAISSGGGRGTFGGEASSGADANANATAIGNAVTVYDGGTTDGGLTAGGAAGVQAGSTATATVKQNIVTVKDGATGGTVKARPPPP